MGNMPVRQWLLYSQPWRHQKETTLIGISSEDWLSEREFLFISLNRKLITERFFIRKTALTTILAYFPTLV